MNKEANILHKNLDCLFVYTILVDFEIDRLSKFCSIVNTTFQHMYGRVLQIDLHKFEIEIYKVEYDV